MTLSHPTLPPTVTSVKLRSLQFRGISFSVQYDEKEIRFTAVDGGGQQAAAAAAAAGQQLAVSAGSGAAQKLGAAPLVFPLTAGATFTIAPASDFSSLLIGSSGGVLLLQHQ